jgi:hypothetical protein
MCDSGILHELLILHGLIVEVLVLVEKLMGTAGSNGSGSTYSRHLGAALLRIVWVGWPRSVQDVVGPLVRRDIIHLDWRDLGPFTL